MVMMTPQGGTMSAEAATSLPTRKRALLGALGSMLLLPAFVTGAGAQDAPSAPPIAAGSAGFATPAPTAADAAVSAAPAAAPPSIPTQTFVDDEDLPKKPANSAPPDPSNTGEASKAHLPHNLSPWGMFLAADWVVKGVMISLAIASVLVWTAWLAKLVQVSLARRRARAHTAKLEEMANIAAAAAAFASGHTPVAAMVRATVRELDLSEKGAMPADGIKERVVSRLSRIEATAGRTMNSGTGLLATVGGTAPFIGLFGTVWGIMNSFIGISKAQTTNLAVVAPGIAEALLATAIGLVAAIPAVIFYNQLARAIGGYKAALADTSAVLERHVSRDLDRMRTSHAFHLTAAE